MATDQRGSRCRGPWRGSLLFVVVIACLLAYPIEIHAKKKLKDLRIESKEKADDAEARSHMKDLMVKSKEKFAKGDWKVSA